ncbi:hypothetical protein LEP1GSC170_1639 [Leptospira interrogans serovar Bataviae str. HAI135]|nr:hypothetical protein LEP1GSC170_1639 [Leptospira interrogans serovar Bataviae str. HAI135]
MENLSAPKKTAKQTCIDVQYFSYKVSTSVRSNLECQRSSFFQSKRVRIERKLQPILNEEFTKEQVVDPRQFQHLLYETNLPLKNGIPVYFASDTEVESTSFAGGKKRF